MPMRIFMRIMIRIMTRIMMIIWSEIIMRIIIKSSLKYNKNKSDVNYNEKYKINRINMNLLIKYGRNYKGKVIDNYYQN